MAAHKLNDEEIEARLDHLDGWTVLDGKLQRDFTFDDFVDAFGFMTKVAIAAESAGHHPEWFNVYNRVSIHLRTHDVGGISDYDFGLAERINKLL